MNVSPSLARSRPHEQRRAATIRDEIERAVTVALSVPKAGRSWVCFFLAQYLSARTGDPLDLDLLAPGRELPPVVFLHEHMDVFEDVPGPPRLLNERLLRSRRLLVLVRDPRDSLVSYWYQKRMREARPVPPSFEQFADSPIYGIERISQGTSLLLDFYGAHPGDRLLESYESLMQDPADRLRRLLRFVLDDQPVDDLCFQKAFEASGFQAMRDWERRLTRRDARLRYADRFGPRQEGPLSDGHFKVRRGTVGGFRTEMSPELQAYVSALPHTAALLRRLACADLPV